MDDHQLAARLAGSTGGVLTSLQSAGLLTGPELGNAGDRVAIFRRDFRALCLSRSQALAAVNLGKLTMQFCFFALKGGIDGATQ